MSVEDHAKQLLDEILEHGTITSDAVKDVLQTEHGKIFFISLYAMAFQNGVDSVMALPQHQFMEQKVVRALETYRDQKSNT